MTHSNIAPFGLFNTILAPKPILVVAPYIARCHHFLTTTISLTSPISMIKTPSKSGNKVKGHVFKSCKLQLRGQNALSKAWDNMGHHHVFENRNFEPFQKYKLLL